VYIAYLDESPVVEPSGTTHFVLVAFSIRAVRWKDSDARLILA
jgi:glucose-6-phosphate 1-dehydrogenase